MPSFPTAQFNLWLAKKLRVYGIRPRLIRTADGGDVDMSGEILVTCFGGTRREGGARSSLDVVRWR